jgi:phage-related protein
MSWTIEYFTDNRGDSPVEEFLNGLQKVERAKATRFLNLLQEFGVELGPPHAKPLTGQKPLWELVPKPNRLIYFLHTNHRFIILHGFTKKRNKTSKQDIATAKRNMKTFLEREGNR